MFLATGAVGEPEAGDRHVITLSGTLLGKTHDVELAFCTNHRRYVTSFTCMFWNWNLSKFEDIRAYVLGTDKFAV